VIEFLEIFMLMRYKFELDLQFARNELRLAELVGDAARARSRRWRIRDLCRALRALQKVETANNEELNKLPQAWVYVETEEDREKEKALKRERLEALPAPASVKRKRQ